MLDYVTGCEGHDGGVWAVACDSASGGASLREGGEGAGIDVCGYFCCCPGEAADRVSNDTSIGGI
jgi:hypothetical protein